MAHPTMELANGVAMPRLGFGTWALRRRTARTAVGAALEAGYRHIDTASMYGNESEVGAAVRESGVDRSEVFVTTKIWNDDHGYERSRHAVTKSRSRLDLDPIDLVLIHWPGGRDRLDTWRQLEELLAEGTVRAIGVSNYTPANLEELLTVASVVPMVNQIEFNPFVRRRQQATVDRCRDLGIAVSAWQPLAQGRVLADPVIADVAERAGRSPAQVLLRWSLQHDVTPLPKSQQSGRIVANAQIFDFELSDADMAALDALS